MNGFPLRALTGVLFFFAAACQAPGPSQDGEALPQRHMVAAANPLAAVAGLEILRTGGSAVDAAIATQLVLGLVEPQSSGIGGGAFLLHYDGVSQAVAAYDGREKAPAAATPDQFMGADGEPMGFYEAVVGGLSVGVPGVVGMLWEAHQDHGRLAWAELFQPAIRLAEQGFKVSPRLNEMIGRDDSLATFPETRDYFYQSDGTPRPVGTLVTNASYASSLRQIAEDGPVAFYQGEIAEAIVARVQSAEKRPGRMTLEDLAAYEAVEREALCRPYRRVIVCGMPPPTSGGATVLQTLGILENFELKTLEPFGPEAAQLFIEASRLAFADRNRYLADADFVDVPLDSLLDPAYLAARAALIDAARSMGMAEPGVHGQQALADQRQFEPPSTSHLSVVDQWGNAVSMTTSVENAFGSRLMAAGFILNNQLTDFSFRPEAEGRPVANRVEPGKRPRSSMSPTLVLSQDGELLMALGSPGGSRIIGFVAQSLLALIDWEMTMQQAFDQPHVVNRNGTTDLEAGTAAENLASALEARGQEINIRSLTSGLHGIRITPEGLDGGADIRREGVAIGD